MKKNSSQKFHALLPLLIGCFLLGKQGLAQPVLSLTPVIQSGLAAPIQFANAGDGTKRVFIVQQGGTILAYDSSFNQLSTFLTVSDVNYGGERGLLSMAFHPDYETNGLFYVYYVNSAGSLELARYLVSSDPNVANAASKVILITIPHPGFTNHNGGELHFGSDGLLYLTTGDGGGGGDGANNAQNTSVLLGKMLRFAVNTSATAPYYTIPAGNPYGNEIFDLGLRNPYRWSFDSQTQDIWIGDVGQDSFEELNFRAAGSTGGVNYGWRCYEGNAPFNTTGCAASSAYTFPVYTYPSQDPSAAITGGVVYRGTAYPMLAGYNVSADFYSGMFYLTRSNGSGGWTTSTQMIAPTGVVDFGEAENGEAYVVSLLANSVYRLSASGIVPVTLASFTGVPNSRGASLSWKTALEENMSHFEVEYSTNGNSYQFAGEVEAQNSAAGFSYSLLHAFSHEGMVFYRLKIVNLDGSYKYSAIVRLSMQGKGGWLVAPSVITNGQMNVSLELPVYKVLELIDRSGKLILRKNIAGQAGQVKVDVGHLASGIYMVRVVGNEGSVTQRVYLQ